MLPQRLYILNVFVSLRYVTQFLKISSICGENKNPCLPCPETLKTRKRSKNLLWTGLSTRGTACRRRDSAPTYACLVKHSKKEGVREGVQTPFYHVFPNGREKIHTISIHPEKKILTALLGDLLYPLLFLIVPCSLPSREDCDCGFLDMPFLAGGYFPPLFSFLRGGFGLPWLDIQDFSFREYCPALQHRNFRQSPPVEAIT